jgi:hypothetical protein
MGLFMSSFHFCLQDRLGNTQSIANEFLMSSKAIVNQFTILSLTFSGAQLVPISSPHFVGSLLQSQSSSALKLPSVHQGIALVRLYLVIPDRDYYQMLSEGLVFSPYIEK